MHIDAHDFGGELVKLAGVPFPTAEEASRFGDDDFGVVIHDGAHKRRKFACSTPEAAAVSSQFLLEGWDWMPKTAAVIAGTTLLLRMSDGGISCPELQEKLASSLGEDFRFQGRLVPSLGPNVVDISDVPLEKKAAFVGSAIKGLSTAGKAIKGAWGAGTTAATAAGEAGGGAMARMGARLKGMWGAGKETATAAGGKVREAWDSTQKAYQKNMDPGMLAKAKAKVTGTPAASPMSSSEAWWDAAGKTMRNTQHSGVRHGLAATGAVGLAGAGAVGVHQMGAADGRQHLRQKQQQARAQYYAARGGQQKYASSLRDKVRERVEREVGEKSQQEKEAGLRERIGNKLIPDIKLEGLDREIRNAVAKRGLMGTAAIGVPAGTYAAGNKKGKKEGRRIGEGAAGSKAYHTGERAGYARAMEKMQAKTAYGFKASYTPANLTPEGAALVQKHQGPPPWDEIDLVEAATAEDRHDEESWKKTAALDGHYDISTPDTIKQAERYFDEHWRNFHPRDRREFAVNTAAQAEAQGVKLASVRMTKYAGQEISTDVLLHMTYRGRQDCVDDRGRDILMKLAEQVPNLTPDELGDALVDFDEHYGVSQQWDGRIPDPYAAVCTEKTAERYTWTDGVNKVTEEELQRAASLDLSSISSALGDSGMREFQKQPVTVFKSLPDPIKKVVARVATARRSTLGNSELT